MRGGRTLSMTVMAWLWIGLSILGAIILAAVVWLAGPLVSIGDAEPFESVLVRLLIIAVILLGRRRNRLAHRFATPGSRQDRPGDDRDASRGQRRAGPEAEDGGRSFGPQADGQVERARPLRPSLVPHHRPARRRQDNGAWRIQASSFRSPGTTPRPRCRASGARAIADPVVH